METTTLDDFLALNDQLSALIEAGIPIDVGVGQLDKDPTRALDKINATVASRVSHGESLSEAIKGDDRAVPAPYRCMVQLGIQSGSFQAALGGPNRLAESVDSWRYVIRSALFYPFVVCCLAYIGLVGFCLFFVPAMENMFISLRISPKRGLQTLEILPDTLPYWIAIPPLAMLLFVVWWFQSKGQPALSSSRPTNLLLRLTDASRDDFHQRCAIFAESLATLLKSQVPLEESLSLAGCASGDATLDEATRALSASLKHGRFPSDDSPVALRFPPFLRWALWHSEATTGRERALQMAAAIYRETAEHRSRRFQVLAPILACVLIGGVVTLLFGLALFVPVVELLKAVAE